MSKTIKHRNQRGGSKILLNALLMCVVVIIVSSCAATKEINNGNLVIKEQGAFSAGGKVITSEGAFDPLKPWNEAQGGQTRHGDHADVFYQIPVNAKHHSMVFLHGYGQSKRSWQTTADGREGYANIFLRKGYSIYLVDQPGRGDAGQATKPIQITATPDDQTWFTQFRIGQYPGFYNGVQFPKDSLSLDQFFRMMTPNTGSVDEATIVDAMSAVFDKSGDGILFTHSAGGAPKRRAKRSSHWALCWLVLTATKTVTPTLSFRGSSRVTRRRMIPSASSFWIRRQHGVGDRVTRRAISATLSDASSCRSARIFVSVSSIGQS